MGGRATFGVVVFIALVLSGVQAGESPYAGMQDREIKAFSAEEVTGYLDGKGMGFAKAAELNSYPGPMHVLELAEQLQLSAAQQRATVAIFDRMHERATRLGADYVAGERALEAMFAEGQATDDRLAALVTEIGSIRAELRLSHLQAHLEMRALLSGPQIITYDELRGYATATEHSGRAGESCPLHGN
jgi:hypothetical protein